MKSITFKELACMYFPHTSPATATQRLRRWIRKNVELYNLLVNNGYYSGIRILTPQHVSLIYYYLGEP